MFPNFMTVLELQPCLHCGKDKRKNILHFSKGLHFQNTVEVKAYLLEVSRMSPLFVFVGLGEALRSLSHVPSLRARE